MINDVNPPRPLLYPVAIQVGPTNLALWCDNECCDNISIGVVQTKLIAGDSECGQLFQGIV